MKGFVPTPVPVVDLMVEKLFHGHPPAADAVLLDPGCGPGAFVEGVLRWCARHKTPRPTLVGLDSDPRHVASATDRFAGVDRVHILRADFLRASTDRFDYIVGNPPYVPLADLNLEERQLYRSAYRTAKGRFDLYLLFFEQALSLLKPGGRLVFITPEKFLYVETSRPLRALLGSFQVEELHFLDEEVFAGLVTYPLVTTVMAVGPPAATRVIHRDGRVTEARLEPLEASWLPAIRGVRDAPPDLTLGAVCTRISCGVATGADSVFVVGEDQLERDLRRFARPTIAGRELTPGTPLNPVHRMLMPYTADGQLLPETRLGALGEYLSEAGRRERLLARTCVARKPWYAYHETPPLGDLLRPKLLCKDISADAFFVPDRAGDIVPRHSVYYLVPADPECLDALADYLQSPPARQWFRDHCQRAAKGFLRFQSHVLKNLPLPGSFERFRRPALPATLQLALQPA